MTATATRTHLLKSYPSTDLGIVRGEDVHLVTASGERYLDMYAGHAVVSTGHCHPHVVRSIQRQAAELIFYSTAVALPIREAAAAALIAHAPPPLARVFFANSGAEANENALKLARRHTGRAGVVSMQGGFHGRSAGAASVTGFDEYRLPSAPLVPGVTFAEFGDLEAAEAAVNGDTAAIIVEPIQSMAGVRTANAEYFQGLRTLCDRSGALLIYDEVQTGFGRTGTMLYAGRHGVVPDLVTLAKGIASGVPLSAVLVNEDVAGPVRFGEYGATFGGGPLAMAALKATLEVIDDERLLDNVRRTGAYLRRATAELPGVVEVRGEGFLIGVKTERDAKAVARDLLDHRVIVGTAHEPGVLRLLPPLTLKESHAGVFVAALEAVLSA